MRSLLAIVTILIIMSCKARIFYVSGLLPYHTMRFKAIDCTLNSEPDEKSSPNKQPFAFTGWRIKPSLSSKREYKITLLDILTIYKGCHSQHLQSFTVTVKMLEMHDLPESQLSIPHHCCLYLYLYIFYYIYIFVMRKN